MTSQVADPAIVFMACACVLAASFLLGSIPWGVVLSKGIYKKDIRDVGSGNIGTTNAVRALGKRGGALVFLLDMGKGLAAGLIGFFVGAWLTGADQAPFLGPLPSQIGQIACALSFLGCTFGHIFTPWLGFHGGKGIAVAFGCELVFLGWGGALLQLAIFALFVLISRMVSLGSVMAAFSLIFIGSYIYWGDWPVIVICAVVAITVIWAHRENISRIIHGQERKIGKRS